MTYQEERVRERKGILVSLIVHALFLLLFFFIVVWKQPNPPTPGMPGVEINFGFDAAGSGETNTMDPASTESTESTEVTEASATSVPVEATTSDMASEHTVPDTKTTQSTPVQSTTTTTSTTQSQTSQQKTTQTNTASGDGNTKQTGNQGSTQGKIDSKGLYPGNGDGGTGPGGNGSLSMAGWHLDADPDVDNASKEAGKVVFSVKIDDEGNILGVNVIENQLSEALVKRCKAEIYKMEFVKNRDNGSTAESSTGTLTFMFRLK